MGYLEKFNSTLSGPAWAGPFPAAGPGRKAAAPPAAHGRATAVRKDKRLGGPLCLLPQAAGLRRAAGPGEGPWFSGPSLLPRA